MNQHHVYGKSYKGTAAENYQRFFVPAIGAPVADDLIAIADLQPGERVLDIACGTGVVTRLAAERVGATGSVTGLDINPGMLAVARSATPPHLSIDWREANAESLPFPDNAFDVVLCQMGLQFVSGKLTALREMRRVLERGGRAVISVPGPKPPLFAIMTDALARHLSQEAAAFGDLVFSMHDIDEIKELMRSAGFGNADVEAKPKNLRLPAPADFLWQYIHSTPLAEPATQADEATRAALQREVCERWKEFVEDDFLSLQVGMTTATALK
ncbi:methyltransferase domain-containing protein [Nitratireductor luteus]|uniref:methyltransferase domain-containing protein n=1 Tax=Nitratireductor luteus TaxID=2976980 RepID=UPI00223F3A8C